MAVLAVSQSSKRLPLGDRVLQTFRTSAIGAAAADEWIDTELSFIDAVLGYVALGAAGEVITVHTGTVGVGANFVKNANGTGVAEGANPGSLGIEVAEGSTNVIEVTVLGRP